MENVISFATSLNSYKHSQSVIMKYLMLNQNI